MFDYNVAARELRITTTSAVNAVIEVGDRLRDSQTPVELAKDMVFKVTGQAVTFTNKFVAMLTAQYLIEQLVKHKELFKADIALAVALQRAEAFYTNPNNQFHFAETKVGGYSAAATETKVVAGVSVEVKADGKFKKGGKQAIAFEMYRKHVIDGGMENKQFVELLMSELQMSKAGATTYLYLVKKQHGQQAVA